MDKYLACLVVLLLLSMAGEAKTYTISLDNTTATIFEALVKINSDGKATPEQGLTTIVIRYITANYDAFFQYQNAELF